MAENNSANNHLKQLADQDVSVWLDYLSRDLIASGKLKRFIDEDGLRGETSNPTIFQQAISEGDAYNAQILELARKDYDAERICWQLMIKDVQTACDVFRPLYDSSGGRHGYVSLEVNPVHARNTDKSIEQGRSLWKDVNRPNLLIKVPATKEGLPVIETLLYDGINVNVTLLFAVQRYDEVMERYLRALERRVAENKPVDRLSSVASFFVSRVDTEADKRFDALAKSKPELASRLDALRGKVAVANARVAYEAFEKMFSGERWSKLAAKGAHVQYPLWASTGTKNKKYADTLYVHELIGPHVVNTMPEDTMNAFRDHGVAERTLTAANAAEAHKVLDELKAVGVDLDDITLNTLENEAVKKFEDSYHQLVDAVAKEREKELSRA